MIAHNAWAAFFPTSILPATRAGIQAFTRSSTISASSVSIFLKAADACALVWLRDSPSDSSCSSYYAGSPDTHSSPNRMHRGLRSRRAAPFQARVAGPELWILAAPTDLARGFRHTNRFRGRAVEQNRPKATSHRCRAARSRHQPGTASATANVPALLSSRLVDLSN